MTTPPPKTKEPERHERPTHFGRHCRHGRIVGASPPTNHLPDAHASYQADDQAKGEGGHLAAPLNFSMLRKPLMPSRPDTTTHKRSTSGNGGSGHPLIRANHTSKGCKITA